MPISRTRLYLILSIACFLGYAWLFFQLHRVTEELGLPTVCLFKNITTIPCPSCGSTRAVLELSQGHLLNAALINPLGLLSGIGLLIIPFWLLFDLFGKRDTLHRSYLKTELFIRRPAPAVVFSLAIIINWIWTIVKGL
ncbi:DUF2752 domain-containing protein [Mangrovibacterium sp.]|uniref:DUF2752 domain-containing protein n=1 Tax=Mangrovibacterium sp. TaxID=1961364 RepID=UPI003563D97F